MHLYITCLLILYSMTVVVADNVTETTTPAETSIVTETSTLTEATTTTEEPTTELPDTTSSTKKNEQYLRDNVNIIAAHLISVLSINDSLTNSSRIQELTDKLKKIAGYVIGNDNFGTLLMKEVKNTVLNATNFYKALNEQDHFRLQKTSNRSLYVTLKERMNRDDILKILSETGGPSMQKSARRMMSDDFVPKRRSEKIVEEAVDTFIAEQNIDNHKFDENDRYSPYWDPQKELEDLNEYHQHDGRRIFRGERTNVRYYPFMVSVQVMGRFWCGGVIYWHDIVLTSAACLQLMHNNRFFRENPKSLAVRVGSNHSRIGGEVIDALEVFFHPSYNPRTLDCNLAIIRLRRRMRFNYHRIPKIIEISKEPGAPPATAEVLLLGWGVTKTSQKMAFEPIFLQRKLLPVYPIAFCKEVYGSKFITENMFCAGTLTTGEGACDHDAGGPAILAGKLLGIISFGPTICGYPNVPTVFTRIGPFADWIETVNESMPSYYRGKMRTTLLTSLPYTIELTTRSITTPSTTEATTTTTATRTMATTSEASPARFKSRYNDDRSDMEDHRYEPFD